MLSSLKTLSLEHDDVFKRAHIFEKATLECFENKKNLSKEEYIKIVTPCKTLFKTGLSVHFKFEEIGLFPIIMGKSNEAKQKVRDLLSDHSRIMKRFSEFETIEDYNLSIQILNDLMKDLSFHAKNEENFFSTIHLSKDETKKIDDIANGLGLKLS